MDDLNVMLILQCLNAYTEPVPSVKTLWVSHLSFVYSVN